MAKQKKPEDEQNPQQPPQGQPGGEQGKEQPAGESTPGTPPTPEEQAEKTPPVTSEGEKPQTVIVDAEGKQVKGPEYEPEPEKPTQPVPTVTQEQPQAPPESVEVPQYMTHKSGIKIPLEDFNDENVVWAEKFEQGRWDAKRFTRRTWDTLTTGKARRFRSQPHSGWTRLAPSLPEWEELRRAFEEGEEGGEGRVGPRPGDRNNP